MVSQQQRALCIADHPSFKVRIIHDIIVIRQQCQQLCICQQILYKWLAAALQASPAAAPGLGQRQVQLGCRRR